jgi:hypothetical protein
MCLILGAMDKRTAILKLNDHGTTPILTNRNTRFANVNQSKSVWWLDIPLDLLKEAEPVLNLVLAGTQPWEIFHLRVPKDWLKQKIETQGLIVREDKGVISLELSCEKKSLFQGVRSKSEHLSFAQFRVG